MTKEWPCCYSLWHRRFTPFGDEALDKTCKSIIPGQRTGAEVRTSTGHHAASVQRYIRLYFISQPENRVFRFGPRVQNEQRMFKASIAPGTRTSPLVADFAGKHLHGCDRIQ